MKALILSDLHASSSSHSGKPTNEYAMLMHRAIQRTKVAELDCLIVCGDVVHESSNETGRKIITELRGIAAVYGIDFFAVPGNHDTLPTEEFQNLTGTPEGFVKIKDAGLFFFYDSYQNEENPRKISDVMLEKLVKAREENPALPIIAIAHSPVLKIQRTAMRHDEEKLKDFFAEQKISAFISGHFHLGVNESTHNGVIYKTIPALYKTPFKCSLMTVERGNVTFEDMILSHAHDELDDNHAHTEFAYCGRGISAMDVVRKSQLFGLKNQGLTEHAFALYCDLNALNFAWQRNPEILYSIWKTPSRGRMTKYKKWIKTVRSPNVRIGLEVDLFDHGKLALSPDDFEDWDYLIGAIHEIEDITSANTQLEVESAFMRDVEFILDKPVKILAHPFRYFNWHNRTTPKHLYRPVAKILKEKNIAAEINHHKNPFDISFFELCIEEGVKISLGSDAHISRNIANMWPHLETLKQLGITTKEEREKILLQW